MSALAERPAVSVELTIDPERREFQRVGARIAALVLIGAIPEPVGFAEMTVGDYLLSVPYVNRRQVLGWLRGACLHPWVTGEQLKPRHRHALARQLTQLVKGAE